MDSAGPVLLPVWTEQHGPGAQTDSLRDSVTYDGWERVAAVVMLRNNAVIQRDTFRFNRTGDILTTAGAEQYDAVTGRLLQRTDAGGTWSYTYDRAGNLVQAVQGSVTWVYGYDALNRLRSVRRNGVLIARYAYDVLGRRIVKRVYSSVSGGTVAYTRFVYHGAHVAFETDSAGTIGLRYTWGPATDDVLAIRDAGGNHYYVTQDVLRSVRGLVKRDGSWARSLRYGPYGVVVKDTSASGAPAWELRYRWTGREYDAETGWYYFRTRYYDPGVRRFVQEDAIGYAGGTNVYAYGEGSPLAGRDPDGLRMNWIWYMEDPFPPCLSNLCPRGGSGGGWRRYEGFLGGWPSAFEFADLVTSYELSYSGNLQFTDAEAYWAYLDLRRAAYNALGAGDGRLLSALDQVASLTNLVIATVTPGGCLYGAPACSAIIYPGGPNELRVVGLDTVQLEAEGISAAVALAHELGHVSGLGAPVPPSMVPYSTALNEYIAFYYENLARAALGCMSRNWSHIDFRPLCP